MLSANSDWRPTAEQVRDGPNVPVAFHRADRTFYVIMVFEGEPLGIHAELNPGTLMITDMHDNILWEAPKDGE